jgi:ATP synthase protein I
MSEPERKPTQIDTQFSRKVERKAQRHLRATRHQQRSVWFGLGMFGLVGWSIAVPTVAGIALGIWLDRQWSGQISWTLTMLFLGLGLGCINAWRWVKHESAHDGPAMDDKGGNQGGE